MNTIQVYSRPVDGSIPVPALLYDDESLLATQHSVGLYDGTFKSPAHQSGSAHVTTHRLFFITDADSDSNSNTSALPDPAGRGHSVVFPLHIIAETQHYAGFFKSSPKLTLIFHPPAADTRDSSKLLRPTVDDDLASWECDICAYRNPPGLSPSARSVCALCGVPRTSSSGSEPSQANQQARSEAPSPELDSQTQIPSSSDPIPCPACTFHNHPSLTHCEICGTQLPTPPPSTSARSSTPRFSSAPASRPDSPNGTRPPQSTGPSSIRLSFRKGGDKPFYAHLKRALLGKAWEVNKLSKGTSSGAKTASKPEDPNSTISGPNSREGIHHILHTLTTTSTTTTASLSHAFADLEIFMAQARDMVRFAEDLGTKLEALERRGANNTNGGGSNALDGISGDQDAKATIIRNSLAQLGLQSRLHVAAPLPSSSTTNNSALSGSGPSGDSGYLSTDKDEQAWLAGLAKELAVVLQGPRDSSSTGRLGSGSGSSSAQWSGSGSALGTVGGVVKSKGDAWSKENEGKVGMMRVREIVSLDEVWGAWNRARGVSLIPPPTLIQTLTYLPQHTSPPIHSRTLRSGLVVLHTPKYGKEEVVKRLIRAIRRGEDKTKEDNLHNNDNNEYNDCDNDYDNGDYNYDLDDPTNPGYGLSTPTFAHLENLPISLISDLILEAEASGVICRDGGGTGFGFGGDADFDFVAGGSGAGVGKATSTRPRNLEGLGEDLKNSAMGSKLNALAGKVGIRTRTNVEGEYGDSAYLSTDVRWYVNVWKDYVWDGQV